MTTAPAPLTDEQVAILRKLGRGGTAQAKTNALVVQYHSDTQEHSIYVVATPRPIPGADAMANYGDVRFHFPADGQNEIYNAGERVRLGRKDVPKEGPKPFRLVAQVSHGYHGGQLDALASIGNLIRKGDRLYIKFIIGNTNQTLKDAGMAQDEAFISIRRPDNKLLATFPVSVIVRKVGSGYAMTDHTYRGTQSTVAS